MKKKFLALALTAVMALSMAACGGDTQSTDTDASSDASGAETGGDGQTYTVGIIQQVQHGLGGHAHTFGRNAGKFHEAASFLKRFLSQERKSSGVFSSKGACAGTLLKSPVKKV